MNIRLFEEKDIAAFCEAIGQVAREQKYILTTEQPSSDRMREWVMPYLDGNYSHYVLEHQQKIIGWADITQLRRESLSHIGRLGMGITRPFRGQGYGEQLLLRALTQAWKMGLKRIELEVFSNNTVAINLYKKHGFETEGVKKKACYLRNEYLDIMCMAQLRI